MRREHELDASVVVAVLACDLWNKDPLLDEQQCVELSLIGVVASMKVDRIGQSCSSQDEILFKRYGI